MRVEACMMFVTRRHDLGDSQAKRIHSYLTRYRLDCSRCYTKYPLLITRGLSCKPNSHVPWSTSELRVRSAPWNRFKPSGKIFLLTVPRQYFFCGSFMLFLVCVCYAFVCVCLVLPCGHLLGKDWPLGSRLWCHIVSLLLSHWYPGSGVVLDCIYSWSLPSFVLCTFGLFTPNVDRCPPHSVIIAQAKCAVATSNCIESRCIYKKMHYLTFDFVVKVTRYVAQYLHHVTYSPAKFEVLTSNGLHGLGRDAFSWKWMIWPLTLTLGSRYLTICPVSSSPCDLCICTVWRCLVQRLRGRCNNKKIIYLTLTFRSNVTRNIANTCTICIMWPMKLQCLKLLRLTL